MPVDLKLAPKQKRPAGEPCCEPIAESTPERVLIGLPSGSLVLVMESQAQEVTPCLRCMFKIRPKDGVLPRVCPNCGLPTLSPVKLEAMKRVEGLHRAGAINDAQFAAARRSIIEQES